MTLPFTSPWLLAPMDGITDVSYRSLVLSRHRPENLGGAFTEFVRVTGDPIGVRCLRRHIGAERHPMPVGLQLMGNNVPAMAETARRAEWAGAPIIDINFGCPARGALRTCAGSALLDTPHAIERIVRACVDAVRDVPVTAKVRAGVDGDRGVEDIARAVEQGGAEMLTIHCRTREEGYRDDAIDWRRIDRAVAAIDIPVCGNGGVSRHAELESMRERTGCRYVMVGRGALADPWIFSDETITREHAARFLLEYVDRLQEFGRACVKASAARIKQLLRYWTAGDLVGDERLTWLREQDPEHLITRLEVAAGSAAGARR